MDGLKMLTTAELAARLNVSTDTVRRMCHSGKWPHSKIGRLFRFTEEHYQTIIATPEAPQPWTKERRDNIAKMLQALGGRPI